MISDDRGIAAAILAGGEARRMAGANKAALRINGDRIIDRQLALLRQVADPVVIISGHADRFEGLSAAVVADVVPGAGALGGIYTALLSSPHARTLVVACDMPFLSLPWLQRLTQPSTADLVIPRSARGYEPLCAVWAVRAADTVRRRIARGQLTAARLVEELHIEEIGPESLAPFDPHGLLFVNVNTPHEYERARALSRLESKQSQDRIMDVSGAGPKPT